MARPRIPDGQPMSASTIIRRKREKGEIIPRRAFTEKNINFFQEWSPELAWLLGILWTDGCLFKNTIEFCSKDSDAVEFVDTLTGADNIRIKNAGQHLRTYFTSKTVADILRNLGFHERKSFTIRWPRGIPEQFEGHFVRGIIDGDGWVSLHSYRLNQYAPDLQVGFCTASYGFLQDFIYWLNKNNISYYVRRCKSTWHVQIIAHKSLRQLYRLAYPRGTDEVALIRKASQYHIWITHPRGPSGRRRQVEI